MTPQTVQKAEKKAVYPKIIIALIIILLIVGGGTFFYLSQTAEKRVVAYLRDNGFEYAKLETDWRGQFTAQDIKKKFIMGIEARIQTMNGDVSWSGSKNNSLKFDNVSYKFQNINVSIPLVELKKVVILDQKTKPVSLINFNAEEARIPSIEVDSSQNGLTQKVTYQNLVYKQLQSGIIEKITADRATIDTTYNADIAAKTGIKNVSGILNSLSIDNTNLEAFLAYYSQTSPAFDNSNPPRQFFGAWVLKDNKFITHYVQKSDGIMEIAEISGSGFSTRLLPFSLLDWVADIQKTENGTITNKAEITAIQNKSFEILSAFEKMDLKIKGLKFSDTNANMSLDEMSFDYNHGSFSGLLSGMNANSKEGIVAIDKFAIDDMRFPKAINMIKKLQLLEDQHLDYSENLALTQQAAFAFIPRFKHIEINGINVQPNAGSHMEKGQLDSLIVDADFSRESIPTRLRVVLKGVKIPVEELDKDLPKILANGQGFLQTLGYDSLNTDMTFDAKWNDETQVLALNEFSYNIQDLGGIAIKGTVNNLNEAFFTDNAVTIAAAALGARVKELNINANFDGLANHLEAFSKNPENNFDFQEQRHQLAMQLRVAIAMFLGADMSQKIGEGIQNFVEKGGTLDINAKAKSERGLGMFDFISAQSDPLSLLGKIDLSAQTHH